MLFVFMASTASDVNALLDNCMILSTAIHLSYVRMCFSLRGFGGGDIAIVTFMLRLN